MLVSCPKCDSRYKLPEEKVRSSGTKVRCPRCQNTFHVFPENESRSQASPKKNVEPPPPAVKEPSPFSAESKRREPSIKRSAASLFANQEQEHSNEEPEEDDRPSGAFIESAKTMISVQRDAPSVSKKIKESSPFKKQPSKKIAPAVEEDHDEIENNNDGATEMGASMYDDKARLSELIRMSEDEDSDSDVRPFGDATFAEIQVRSRPKSKKKFIIGLVASIAIAAGVFIFINRPESESPKQTAESNFDSGPPSSNKNEATHNQSSAHNNSQTVATLSGSSLKRPADWYRDDPRVFQDYLSQIATLPPSEQQKPENRALIAEALVLNGLMNGAEDQIVSGMGYASGLIAAYPNQIYGFYGLTAYALFKDDVQTLADLIRRWPTSNHGDPEYRLARSIVDSKTGDYRGAVQNLIALLGEYPDLFRAEAWALMIALDHPKDTEKIMAPERFQSLIRSFQKHRSQFRPGTTPPALYINIEKKLKKNKYAQNLAKSQKIEKAKSQPATEVKPKSNPVVTSSIKAAPKSVSDPKSSKLVEASKPTTKTQVAEKPSLAQPAPTDKKTLPKADPELIALNKQTNQAKKAATKLYEDGKQKQRESKIDEAIQLYQSALREDPDLADVYRSLGEIYMNRQEKDRALRAFKIYLQLKPESQDRQVVQGWISSMQ